MTHKKHTFIICGILLAISILGIMFLRNNEEQVTGQTVQQELEQTKKPTAENALESLLEAEDDLREMQKQGLSTYFIQDNLLKAKRTFIGKNTFLIKGLLYGRKEGLKKKYLEHLMKVYENTPKHELENVNYEETIRLTNLINDKKLQAYKITDIIEILKEKEKKYRIKGADTMDAIELIGKAKKEFNEERYDNAEEYLKQADAALELAHKEHMEMKKKWRSVKNFLSKYGTYVIVLFIIITGLIHYIRKKVDV